MTESAPRSQTDEPRPLRVGVIGAAGQTGPHVVRALRLGGASPVALIHRESQAGVAVASGALETRVIELEGPRANALAEALDGLDAVYFIPPVFHPQEHLLAGTAIRACEVAGVPRFALHSVLHPWTPGLPHHQLKAEAEALLRASTLGWTVLRPAMYAQTVLFYISDETDEVRIPYSLAAPFTVIDVHDVGQAAAVVLLNPGHEFATYELAGPEVLTMGQLVEQVGDASGRRLIVSEAPPWGRPVPPTWSRHQFASVAALWSHYDVHGLVGNANIARLVLGRAPSTFAEALAREGIEAAP